MNIQHEIRSYLKQIKSISLLQCLDPDPPKNADPDADPDPGKMRKALK